MILSLATKSCNKDKQSKQWANHTEWHRVVTFAEPADFAKKLKKGDYVEIEGELRSTEFDKEIGGSKKKTPIKQRSWEVRACIVRKLAQSENSREKEFDSEPITEEDAAERAAQLMRRAGIYLGQK